MCFLGFRQLLIGGWKDRSIGLVITAAGAGLVVSGAMTLAGLDL